MEPTIISARLALEPLRLEHAREMVGVLADESLHDFTGGEAPSLNSLEARYRNQIAGSGRPDEVWRNWILRLVEDGRAVGFAQADIIGDVAELAWVVGVADQGRGYATEAAIAVRDQLMTEGLGRFQAYIHRDHSASQSVAKRVGMTRTGGVDDAGEEQWLVVFA